ncbi:hypothetical protein DPMN_111666 [Dreissena polymorpha]|uniref:Uncharacterized protein n=1 Tax=Dreissena polymorpha TaxID=45954 RepID=A0A9D4QP97_DREPO|nr:hypothetical protein DPMN_111666 [Dreissena polymorpha]
MGYYRTKTEGLYENPLGLGNQVDNTDIDRAHRVKSRNKTECTIIAHFTRFKDCEFIFNKAKTTWKSNSPFSVQQDFSDRVKLHRHKLGERLIIEQKRATMHP